MKNHFFIPYYGNKRQEVEKIYDIIKAKLVNVDYIIEPFCGSAALSYYISLLHPGKYRYVLNDNNEILVELYKLAQDEEKWDKYIDDVIVLYNTINTKEDYQRIVKMNTKEGYMIKHKIYAIRPGLFPAGKIYGKDYLDNMKKAPILDFLRRENVIITCDDAIKIVNVYKEHEKSLLFLDPPYIDSDNTWYKAPTTNVYEYLYDNDISKMKSYIVLCLQNNWIIKLLFKGKNNITYDKRYETTHKSTTHIIIDNTVVRLTTAPTIRGELIV